MVRVAKLALPDRVLQAKQTIGRAAGFVAAQADAQQAALREFLRIPRHAMVSAVASLDDQRPPPSERLLDIALAACAGARAVDLSEVAARTATEQEHGWILQWPGEHYRLLAALAASVAPALAVEVGTYTGFGALALLSGLPATSSVVTYDVVPWSDFPDTALGDDDFTGRLTQRIGDLSDPACFLAERDVLRGAGLIFVDAPKDGVFEHAFLEALLPALAGTGAILVFDDIRMPVMLKLWRDLPVPKLDLTSFGHWCGTGLAEVP